MKKLIASIAGIVVIAIACITAALGLLGRGNGDGIGVRNSAQMGESISDASNSSEETQILKIRIEENKIYFDDELCADANELKQKITDIGAEREYTFEYYHAIKNTYDEVNGILKELENALGITVTEIPYSTES